MQITKKTTVKTTPDQGIRPNAPQKYTKPPRRRRKKNTISANRLLDQLAQYIPSEK